MNRTFQLVVPLTLFFAGCDANLRVQTAPNGLAGPGDSGSGILTYEKTLSNSLTPEAFVPLGGQCAEGDVIGVRANVAREYLADTTCQDGRWYVEIPLAEVEQNTGLIVEVIGKAGSSEAQLTIEIDLEKVRPTVSIDDAYVVAGNAGQFRLKGSCSASQQKVTISGAATFDVMCEDGRWEQVLDLSAQADGPLTFIADHKNEKSWPAKPATKVILKDAVAPTLAFDALQTINIANANQYVLSGSCSENEETVVVTGSIAATASCLGGAFQVVVNTSSIADGATASFSAVILDKAGNSSALAQRATYKDVTAPMVGMNPAGPINSGNQANFTLSGTCSEETRTVLVTGDINASATCGGGLWSLVADVSTLADGPLTVHATQDDAAGNTSAPATRVLLKSTGLPVVGIDPLTVSIANQTSGPITGSCSVPGQNVVIGGDVSASVLCMGGVYSANVDFSGLSDGNVNITADHADADGNNANQASRTILKDTLAPVFTSLISANSAADGFVNASELSSAAPLFVLVASGHVTATYSVIQNDQPSIVCDGAQAYGGAAIPQINELPVSDASYVLCVRLADAAGNVTYGKSQPVMRDTIAPTVNVGLDVIARTSTALSGTVSGAATFAWSSMSGPGTVNFSAPSAKDTDAAATVDGIYVLRLTVTDDAGNSAFDELNLDWDTTAPTFVSLLGVDEASDGYINAGEVGASGPLFQLDASGYSSASYALPFDHSMPFTCDDSKTYDQAAIPPVNSLPASDKPYAICVQLTDAAGNVAYGKSSIVTRDAVSPTVDAGSDVIVNGVHSFDAHTTDGDVFAWTQTSGAGTVTFGSASAEDTTASASADGVYGLRLTVTDAAGNSAFDDVTLTWDATAPVFTSLNGVNEASDGLISGGEVSAVGVIASLVASGHTGASYSAIFDDTPAVTCNGLIGYPNLAMPSINSIPASDDSYALCVRLVDDAGNVTYGKSQVFVRDTVPPAFMSLVGANGATDGYINGVEASSTSPLLVLAASGYDTMEYSGILDDTPSVVCDQLISYGNIAIPAINTLPSTDESYAVCAKLVDGAGNVTYGKSTTIVRDTTPPAVNVGLDLIANATVNLNATSNDAVIFAWSKIGGPGTISFGDASVEDTAVTAGTDGSYVLRLMVADVAGNSSYDELNLVWDTTAPIFTSLVAINEASDGYVSAAEVGAVSPMLQLNASGYDAASYSAPIDDSIPVVCDAAKSYGPATVPTISSIPSSDKPYAVCVRLTDAAGNATYGKSSVVVRDVAPPTVNVGSDVTVNGTHAINPVTSGGVTFAWSQISGAGTVSFGSPAAAATTASASGDGVYGLRLTVTDEAGNSASDDLVMTWNTSGPVFTSLSGANQAADGYVSSAEAGSASAMFVLNAANYTSVEYTGILDESSPQTCNASQSYAPSSIPLINALPASDKPYVICVKLSDAASNIVYGKSQIIVRDTVPPTVDVGGDVVTNDVRTIDASSSGGATYAWSKISGGGTITFGSVSAEDTSVSASADGAYVLRLTVTDAAGNSAFDELNLTWDTTPPVLTSLVGANQASDGHINASETSATGAIVTLAASGHTTAEYSAILDNTPSITCNASTTWIGTSVPAINAMTAVDDTYAVCVKITDAAGNVSYGKSQSIVRDTVAPTVNVGADFNVSGSIAIDAVTSGAVSFAWTKQAGPGTITFGNPNSEDTGAGASSDGAYVLRLTATDAAGNNAHDELSYVKDTVAPVFTSLVGANQASDAYINASETSATGAIVTLAASGHTTAEYSAILDNNPSVTCSSATYVGSSIPTINTMPSTDEVYAVCVKLSDAAGNVTYGKSSNITRDTVAPVLASLLGANQASDGYINVSETSATGAIVTLSASGHTTAEYSAILDNNPSITCNASTTWVGTSIPAINTMTATDEAYAVCVKLTDAAGNVTYGKSQTIVRDTGAPAVNAGVDVTVNALHSLNATTSGASSYAWSKISGSGTITFGSASTEDTSVSANADGAYVLRLTVTDAAGNSAFDELNLTWDTTPPVFTSLLGANQASDGYLNASETSATGAIVALSASGHTMAEYSAILDNSPSITCNASTTWVGTSIPAINAMTAVDDAYAVCVKLTDTAGNVTYGKSQSIVRDTLAPTVNVGADLVVNVGTAIDAVTSGASTFSWTKVSGTGTITFTPANAEDTTVSASAEETYVLRLTVTDVAGNVASDDLGFTWDTTAPALMFLLGTNQANDGYINASETSATGAIVALSASGHTTAEYSAILDNNPSVTCSAATYVGTSIPTINTMPSSDEVYAVCVKLSDAAGNATYGKSSNITRDTVAPLFNSLVGANQAIDGYVNASETSATGAIVTLSASGHTTADYSAILDNNPSITCNASTTWVGTSIPAINSMPATDEIYAVCVRLTDVAGNVTYGKSQSIVRDTGAPTFTSLPLANQAADGALNNADIAANNAIVGVLSASGYATAHYVVALSAAACSSQTYTSTSAPLAGTLSTNGTYKVCVRLTDSAGNVAYGNSGNVTVDTTVPTVNVGPDQGRNYQFTITPIVSGATSYQWSVTSGTAANITFGSPTAATTTVSASVSGEYTLRLTASSSAGNTAYDELYFYALPVSGNHTAFITSTTYTGNLGGLTGADSICNTRAAAGGLTGNFKALLSTSSVNAISRVPITGPVVLKNGVIVADNSGDLWDGSLDNPWNITELGTSVSDQRPWTGSNNAGSFVSGASCADWTDGVSSTYGNQGYTTTSNIWIGGGYSYFCHTPTPLYCLAVTGGNPDIFTATTSPSVGMGVDLAFYLPPSVTGYHTIDLRRATGTNAPACNAGTLVHTWNGPFTAGSKLTRSDVGAASTVYSYTACVKNSGGTVIRAYEVENVTSSIAKHVVFMTSQRYAAGSLGGLAGADAQCQTRASIAGLAGTFKALLSSSTVDVKDRITISMPIYNRAEQLVANNATDFWDGSIAAPIAYTESGSYTNYYAATGSTSAGLKSTGFMCADWSSSTGSVAYGITQSTTSTWIQYSTSWACSDSNLHLYCISQ